MRALASLIMSPRQWAVDDSPQCSRDSGETGGNRKKQYPNPDECRGGRMVVSIYRFLQGVEKNSRCSLRRMRCAYCEDCAKAQNEERATLVE